MVKVYEERSESALAGHYERAAEEFMQMKDYRDSRYRIYEAAVGLYRTRQYEKALPYFVWLGEDIDGGYYLRKCREKLGLDPQGLLPCPLPDQQAKNAKTVSTPRDFGYNKG